jgi:hypothetical protein
MGNLIFGPWPPAVHANLHMIHLARELGKSRKQVKRYVDAGMPHEFDADGYPIFNLAKCLAWLDAQRETG